jgi:hypothetical protein
MKWFQKIMGLKDKVAAQEAKFMPVEKQKQVEEKVVKQEPVQKVVKAKPNNNGLTKEESAFIIAKLRQAEYKGSEFEQFYTIMQKLQKSL